jgi:sugar lactone lactonase YvrE
MANTRVVLEGGSFFEGPRWHDGRWWVSDFYRRVVLSFEGDGGDVREEAIVDRQPSGLGWAPDGTLLVISMLDQRLLRRAANGAMEVCADLSGLARGACNDMVVDSLGRAWIGTFGFDYFAGDKFEPGSLIRVDPDGTALIAAEDLRLPNGSVITPDSSTLIVGQTFGSCYTAFAIADDGSLLDRRVWAQFPPRSVFPDGCCLDAEGRIWCADAGGKGALLVEEGGRIVSAIGPPEGLNTYACMLGGPDGITLLQCCAPESHQQYRESVREAILVATNVDAPHAGRP